LIKYSSWRCSPHQVKWATFSSGFNEITIFCQKTNTNHPVICQSLEVSIFSPIIILFLQYSCIRNFYVPEMWLIQHLIFYTKLVDCILFKIVVQHVYIFFYNFLDYLNQAEALRIQLRGENYTVCGSHWNSGISDYICQTLGYK
jgi:hypothetical protein